MNWTNVTRTIFIIKGDNAEPQPETSAVGAVAHRTSSESSSNPAVIQMLYIQMEFCEKSTLRQLIDSFSLHNNAKRAWQLFREILEGLVHIHQQVCRVLIFRIIFY